MNGKKEKNYEVSTSNIFADLGLEDSEEQIIVVEKYMISQEYVRMKNTYSPGEFDALIGRRKYKKKNHRNVAGT